MSQLPLPLRSSGVIWSRVEPGFHVGSRGGDFLGYVERQSDGSYRAHDLRSQTVGDFADLHSATRAVEALECARPTEGAS
ncbi:hypothetical protein [Schumannella soli]|uniref:Uncharacterized protein n=1 Tax=Schumannella soli TaxID=2590779 RepID=A0A506Y611_9MICO|nr:hypothetical protein [Schumannella soli]TPW77455.1 hypothetical protein FJ657_01870 [Schumannella soli]